MHIGLLKDKIVMTPTIKLQVEVVEVEVHHLEQLNILEEQVHQDKVMMAEQELHKILHLTTEQVVEEEQEVQEVLVLLHQEEMVALVNHLQLKVLQLHLVVEVVALHFQEVQEVLVALEVEEQEVQQDKVRQVQLILAVVAVVLKETARLELMEVLVELY